MKNLPQMISTKDILYICDMFNWHLVTAKKIETYMTQVTDKNASNKLSDLCNFHYETCEELIKLLESGGN